MEGPWYGVIVRGVRVVLSFLLALSVFGNAWQLLRRTPEPQGVQGASAPPAAMRLARSAPLPCAVRLASVEGEILGAMSVLAPHVPAETVFSVGEGNPQAQAALMPILHKILDRGRSDRQFDLECHLLACRLVVEMKADDDVSWYPDLSHDTDLRDLIELAPQAAARGTGASPLTSVGEKRWTVFLKLRNEAERAP